MIPKKYLILSTILLFTVLPATALANFVIEDENILQIEPIQQQILDPSIIGDIELELIDPVEPEPQPEVEEPKSEGEEPKSEEVIKPKEEIRRDVREEPRQKQPSIFDRIGKGIMNNLGVVFAILAVVVAISGFTFAGRRKRRSISKHMNEIDNTYSEYKMKAKRCEAELYRLKDIIDDELKNAKLDDSAYALLVGRIEEYMVEIQKQIVNEKFGGLPGTLKNELFRMMEDGEITDQELDTFQKLIGRSEDLSSSDKDSLLAQVKDFKKQDELLKKRGRR